MAFIRVKKVKDWRYAYLVENKWKSKKTKQKVKEYLGRVHFLENIVGIKFEKDISKLDFKDSVKELIKFELMKNGFREEGNVLKKEKFTVNFDENRFLNGKKPVVFESNEGFICKSTFEKAMNFRKAETEEETGLLLAETILEAGISIPHNVFVKLFEKIHKADMPAIAGTKTFINKV
ncbi:hypothetical protein JW707_04115 [Candidatus Woesearchaeota archaeon]|nr:hypothetical protein [Candidatus Woesearchaeota archaeon]